ncbi:putative glutamate carboxypeptidase tre2 [Phaeomoniella chlamydospora]|uniref:Putative glutamate carboxypeptidase tre2 n=1 Tax=Phaeomoniella chlamydospora TaxID=158046 RepID=A0A0G2EX99_PHACM|nr:putative glutamate carboxypeptidase tre2 [Phaeomoniella chlamydospora]
MGEKDRYIAVPIPSYEEATSSRPTSSQSRLGPEEISDDAERQGLLTNAQESTSNYEPPRVDSARSSVDLLASEDGRGSTEELRREVEQMEVEDPVMNSRSMGNRFSKRLNSITRSLSSLNLPFKRFFPSLNIAQIREFIITSEINSFVIIGRLFGIFLIVSVIYLLIASDVLSFGNRSSMGQIYDPESIRVFVQKHMNQHGDMEKYLERVTLTPHIAGSEGNYVLAEWVQELFKEALDETAIDRYDVYLNYPIPDGRSVEIVDPPGTAWKAQIDENPAYPDRQQSLAFHGNSKAGNVTGHLVYANYGSREDFQYLADNGINVNGSIALVRYGGTQGDRALKIKAAELAGAIGCIIYSDPAEDGFLKGPPWPEGQTRPKDGVQRGGVSLMSMVVGDVLSPGWASTPSDKHRITPDESSGMNRIPSLPLSWADAQHLLQSLKGHGKQVSASWKGGVPDVEWWTGDKSAPKVQLANIQDEEVYQPIYNVLGSITGWEQPEKRIVVGNHRDAWCFGATDPGSGTAVMLEVVRIFGQLRQQGWRPLRTIEFASWDAEEYNLVGSTEHVESREEELRLNGYAYVNVDVAVSGDKFSAAASPVFQRSLLRVLDRVSDPNVNKTLREIWDSNNSKLEGLGAGSDYVAFQDIAGTSSIDMTFEGSTPYPYHSCYDNYQWMTTVGDPGFKYHKTMGEVLALLILELSDRPILPFDMENYATSLTQYVDDLQKWVETRQTKEHQLDITSLRSVADQFKAEASAFEKWEQEWTDVVYSSNGFESNVLGIRRAAHNNRMANFETHLLDLEEGGGLVNRTQFKHVIFAPQVWSGYDEAFFPGIRDAVEVNDWESARDQVKKVARILSHAINKLNGN